MKSICFIVDRYPTKDDPSYAFIKPVVHEMAKKGINCTVIAAQSITNSIKEHRRIRPYMWFDYTESGEKITIYQPKYISLSMLSIMGINLTQMIVENVVYRCFQKNKISTEVLYGHFWRCGMLACKIAQTTNIPVFTVSGESVIDLYKYYKKDKVKKYLRHIKGVISVSTKNINESRSLKLLNKKVKHIVLPNAYDSKVFYHDDKDKAKAKLGISDSIVGISVGTVSERKGQNRIIEAAKSIPGLKLVFIGDGADELKSDQIIFSGKLPHDEIANYLNAADFFVLPTLAEGCCNAIIEALACGLPVISSDLEFNYDVLDEKNSILINPNSIEELMSAMSELYNNEQSRVRLSTGALETANNLHIERRVQRIMKFIDSTVEKI